jgi:hypothetical protein
MLPLWLSDCVFAVDIYFRLFRFLIFRDGNLVTNEREIRTRYLKTMFWRDVLATFPFDLFGLLHSFEVAYWLRLPKMIRLSRLFETMSDFEQLLKDQFGRRVDSMYSRYLKVVYVYLMFGSLWGCCFFYAAWAEDRETSWTMLFQKQPSYDQYFTWFVRAEYWVYILMTTTGYGDIRPRTSAETIVGVLIQLTGAMCYALLIGSYASLMVSTDAAATLFEHKMSRLAHYIRYRGLPPALSARIDDYYHNVWNLEGGIQASAVLDSLPPTLRNEVLYFRTSRTLAQVKLFEGLGSGFLSKLATLLKAQTFPPGLSVSPPVCISLSRSLSVFFLGSRFPHLFAPPPLSCSFSFFLCLGDYVVHAGDTDQDMYLVNSGVLEVVDPKTRQVCVHCLPPCSSSSVFFFFFFSSSLFLNFAFHLTVFFLSFSVSFSVFLLLLLLLLLLFSFCFRFVVS